MKYGFTTLACPDWTLEQAVSAAADYGYDGIELRLIDGQTITPELLASNRRRIQRVFGESPVALIALGSSARFSSADENERAANEAQAAALIQIAGGLKIPLIRVFGGKRPEGVSMEVTIGRVAESLNRLAPIAESSGVALVLETHDDFSRADSVAAVLGSVTSPAVGALWDVEPPHEFGESLQQVVSLLGDRIKHTHVKDARPTSSGEWELVLLGEGEVPIRGMIQELIRLDYSGYVMVEWEKKWHPELAEPEVALPQHLKLLRAYAAG